MWGCGKRQGKRREGPSASEDKVFLLCIHIYILLQLYLTVLFTLLFTILACERNSHLYSYGEAFTILAKLLPIIFQ